MKKMHLVILLLLALLQNLSLKLSAQPHLHIERNLEALRLDGNQSWLSFYDGSAYKGYLWNNLGNLTLGTTEFNPNGQLKFVTNLAERMTIDQLGRVGVNTGSPLAPLHINHDNEALRISGAQSYLNFVNGLGGNAGYLWNKDLFNFELGTSFGNTTGSLTLRTNDNLGIWIDPAGDVGIGAAPSGVKLDVDGVIRSSAPLILNKELYPNPFSTWEIDIGYVSDFSYDDLKFGRNGTFVSYIESDGDYGTFSDIRLKENILPYEKKILDNIAHLDIAVYNYRYTPSKTSFGFLAQNRKEYFPEVVSSSVNEDEEEYLGIAYGKVSVIAIKAIQEQQEIIESLK